MSVAGQLQGTLKSPYGKPPGASRPPSANKSLLVKPQAAVPAAAVAAPTLHAAQGAVSSSNFVDSKLYDVATDEPCASISFVWDNGEHEVGLPYVHFTQWMRSGMNVKFGFGDIEAQVEFDADFPLGALLMNFRFQRVATLYAIPGKVKIMMVKIDPETGATSPL